MVIMDLNRPEFWIGMDGMRVQEQRHLEATAARWAKASKALSAVLRHRAQEYAGYDMGLKLDDGGWVPIDKLLDLPDRAWACKMTLSLLLTVVKTGAKQRFQVAGQEMPWKTAERLGYMGCGPGRPGSAIRGATPADPSESAVRGATLVGREQTGASSTS